MAINLNQEIIDRINYAYLNIDGSIDFPNSYDGDILKLAYQAATESLSIKEGKL